MRFGTEINGDRVHFRLWAPYQPAVSLVLTGSGRVSPMNPTADGWHGLELPGASPGTLYRFRLSDGLEIPDPASRFQPDDVHGPSEVIDPRAHAWQDAAWRGRPWEEAVLYELHVGAFTREGTFRAAIEKLPALVALGVTAIQMMPVGGFPGRQSWGYDGVHLFAPDQSYGRPEDLKALVDAAHGRGLMVILDVVYNHFGPVGNYWPLCGPIFTERHETPWGAAVNFDGSGSPTVRELVIENALFWIDEYHVDGLRLDAVHAMVDDSPVHILDELAHRVRAVRRNRPVHLVLENEANQSSRLGRSANGVPLAYTAQWNDDLHHVLHTAVTGEGDSYYRSYVGDRDKLGRALAEGFAFQGETMPHTGGARGEASAMLPPTAFIGFIQNHDQIGNRAFGERLTAIAPAEAVRAVAAICLLSPQIPMLFMGEEWGASTPFLFFCDLGPELAPAVREGRQREFARFPAFEDPAIRAAIPDPSAASTLEASKLRWEEAETGEHARWRALYGDLIALRQREIVPRLRGIGMHAGTHGLEGNVVRVAWTLGDGTVLTLAANLTPEPEPLPAAVRDGRLLWCEGTVTGGRLGPWTALFRLLDGEKP